MELSEVTAAPTSIQIGERTYTFGRLTLRDWGRLEQAALESYRREFLKMRLDNADLLADGDPAAYKQAVINEAMNLRVPDLPQKKCVMPKTDGAGQPVRDADGKLVQVERLVDYPMWWFNSTVEGRLQAVHLSMVKHHPEITIDKLDELLLEEFLKHGFTAETLADMVGDISVPSGNSQPPLQAAAKPEGKEVLEALNRGRGEVLSERRAKRIKRRQKKSST